MAVENNTIMQADLARVREVDFNTQFNGSLRKLTEALGITRKIAVQEGASLKALKVTGTLESGVVAEAGNHEELLALGGEYHKLYENQFAGIAT